jgi:hypothetical protein
MSKRKLHNNKPKSSRSKSRRQSESLRKGSCLRKIGYDKKEAYKHKKIMVDTDLSIYK